MGFLKGLFEGFCAAAGWVFEKTTAAVTAFFELFQSVKAVIEYVNLFPFITLFGAIGDVVIMGVTSFMELIKDGTMTLFAPNIGAIDGAPSLFEVAVGDMGWLFPIMRILALSLLFIFFMVNIVKIMVSPERGAETPLRLTASTVVAGVAISYAQPVIILIQTKLVLPIYSFILSWGDCDAMDFLGLAETAKNYILFDGGSITQPGSAPAALLSSVVLCFALCVICVHFFKYMLEISQRYVVLGALIITAPVAVTLAATRSTRRSFTAWCRMVGSQFLLMILNLSFLSIFFKSMAGFEDNFARVAETHSDASGLVAIIVWCMLMYGFLYVGAKVDSYLSALGLSVAETGGATLGAIIGDFIDMGAMLTVGLVTSKTRHTSRQAKTAAPVGRLDTSSTRLEQDHRGLYTTHSINRFVKNASAGEIASGKTLGTSVFTNLKGIPKRSMSKLDIKTCSAKNGVISMLALPDETGTSMSLSLIHADKVSSENLPTNHGRWVSIGSDKYLAVPRGPGAERFLTHNPTMRHSLEKQFGDRIVPITTAGGKSTGAFRLYPPSKPLFPGETFIRPISEEVSAMVTPELVDRAFAQGAVMGGEIVTAANLTGYGIQLWHRGRAQGSLSQYETGNDLLDAITLQSDAPLVASANTIRAQRADEINDIMQSLQAVKTNGRETLSAQELMEMSPTVERLRPILAQAGWSISYTSERSDEPVVHEDAEQLIKEDLRSELRGAAVRVVLAERKASEASDPNRDAQLVEEWVPANAYAPDVGLNARMVEEGGIDYWKYSIPQATSGGHTTTRCDEPNIPAESGEREKWLEDQFPSLAAESFHVLSQDKNGIIYLRQASAENKKLFQLAPVASFYVSQETAQTRETRLVHAHNDTRYLLVEQLALEESQELFYRRNGDGPMAQRIMRDYTPFEPYMGFSARNNLANEAMRLRRDTTKKRGKGS